MYSLLIDTYGISKREKDVSKLLSIPVKKKAEWALNWVDSPNC
jgi:hypothetical protein